MIDLEDLYFEWLLSRLDPDGVPEGVAYLGGLLHNCEFHRRVGNDINRAVGGENLRKEFLTQFEEADFSPHVTNELMGHNCSWFEMLVALTRELDFMYDGGVLGRFDELVDNMGIADLSVHDPRRTGVREIRDQRYVNSVTQDIDANNFGYDGQGGLFPLRRSDHSDQRRVEIWDQAGAYFNERL